VLDPVLNGVLKVSEYLVRLVHGLNESQLRLRAVIREARVFRDSIREAFRAGRLNISALGLLRGKLEALIEYYDEAVSGAEA
jgi:hypothetical protein